MKMATTQVITNLQQAQPTIAALEKVEPSALILRVQCTECDSIFAHDAEYILGMTRKHGFFRPSKLCPTCRTSKSVKRKEKKPKSVEAKKKTKKNLKPAAKKPQPKVVKAKKSPRRVVKSTTPAKGFHRPFADALSGIKIELKRPKAAVSEKQH
jgi:hypothetical protein